ILFISLLTINLFSQAQDWKLFGPVGILPYADQHDFTVLDNNRPVVAYVQSNNLDVQFWDGQQWMVMPQIVAGDQVEDVDIVHIGNDIYVGFFDISLSKYLVFKWDGSSWVQIGDTGISAPYLSETASLEVSETQTEIFVSYITTSYTVQVKKWNGASWLPFSADFLSNPYTIKLASEGNKVYAASDVVSGNYEVQLWLSAETAGPFTQFPAGTVSLDPSYYDIDVNPGASPGVCFVTSTQNMEVQCARTNGSIYNFENNLNTGDFIYDMAMAYDSNDSMFVAYVSGGTGETFVYWEQNGWQLLGGALDNNYSYPIDIEVFDPSNRPFVSTTNSGIPEIRAYNFQPVYNSDAGNNSICQDLGGDVYTSITFDDQDHDSLYITAVSLNTGLITSPNIVITRINAYDPFSPTNEFKINIIPEAGQSGVGSVDLYVTDGLDTLIYNVSVTVVASPSFSVSTNGTTCNGSSDGSFTISGLVPGGSYNVSYNLGATNGYTASATGDIAFTGLAAGTYSNINVEYVTTGCSYNDVGTYTISQPTAITMSATPTDVICFGNCDGMISVTAFGGTAPYTYSNNNGSTYQVSSNFTSLCAGSYTVIVQDANACLSAPSVENINSPTAVAHTVTSTDPNCPGSCDGQIVVTPTGGVLPYTYTNNNGSTYQASTTFNSLCSGNYDVFVVDGNGCTSSPSLETLSDPAAMTTTIAGNLATLCDGDSHTLTATATGGASPYNYAWTGISNGVAFTPSVGTGQTINLTITDNNGCTLDTNATIDVNPLPASPSITANSPLCEGADLNLMASTIGGATYAWTGPNAFSSSVQNPTITAVTAAAAGTYFVTATVGGCTSLPGSDIITVSSNPPAFSVSGTNPSACGASDGSFVISGVTPSTSYNIYYTNGGVQGPFNQTSTTGGDLTISGLSAGSYTAITVENGTGCQTVYAGPGVSLSDPSAPTVDAGSDTTICEGEAITLSAYNPGNALISWDNDAINNFTFKPGTTTTYTVTASSAGCVSSDQITVTVNQLPSVAIATTPETCGSSNGTATATINGGATPYDVYWSNGSSTTSISNLKARLYYINVTDANGCYAMDVATVSSTAISVSGVVTDNMCYGDENGSINLTASGAGPLTFEWSNGAVSEDITGLAAGQYEVRIEDVNGCDASASFVVQQPGMIYGVITSTESTCGTPDGSLDATVFGGTPGYTFQWKDDQGNDIGGEVNSNYSSVGAGGYQFEITDVNGCTHMLYSSVSETGGPVVTVDSVVASTCANDGVINIDISSANTISSTTWSSGQTTEDISNIGTGYYSVVVEDVNTCKGALMVEVPAVLPDVQEICIVSVDTTTNTNLIIWEKPITNNIDHYRIYRESSIADLFQFVDTVSYSSLSQYNDTIAYPALRSWRYQITAVDTCGVESLLSPEHKTIHVTIQDAGGGNYDIFWDKYEGFTYPDFTVYRFTTQSGWTLLSTVSNTVTSISDTPPTITGLDYMIEITPPSTCTATNKAQDYNSSRSNTTTSILNTDPNLITELEDLDLQIYPNPSNGLFNLIFEEASNYTIEVYDLSGQLIFNKFVNTDYTVIDLSNLADGPYMLKVTSDVASMTTRIIVH
ncbi:MAG: T9SS type A sorting domain-containing protein, partial [Crocinitomicaceae bacterium]|nr:T9SS type A sorting domain-containing protein [Crocinitomicaceae bacterium]